MIIAQTAFMNEANQLLPPPTYPPPTAPASVPNLSLNNFLTNGDALHVLAWRVH
ncbi:MAG: hypothetical protein ACYCW6_10175 [Candidatus Xenobia bacterium]